MQESGVTSADASNFDLEPAMPPVEEVTPDRKVRQFLDDSAISNHEMAEVENEPNYSLVVRCLAELIGTLIFVFFGSTQSMVVSTMNSAFTHGFVIFVLTSCFSPISGAHFNPAVTIGVTAVRRIDPISAVAYVISQLIGAALGAMISLLVMGKTLYQNAAFGATYLHKDFDWYQGLVAEGIATSLLVLVILLHMVDQNHTHGALAIGFTIVSAGLTIGLMTGASLNPARSLGPNFVGTLFYSSSEWPKNLWSTAYIYYLGPILGALLAATLFRVFFSRELRLVK